MKACEATSLPQLVLDLWRRVDELEGQLKTLEARLEKRLS